MLNLCLYQVKLQFAIVMKRKKSYKILHVTPSNTHFGAQPVDEAWRWAPELHRLTMMSFVFAQLTTHLTENNT